MPGKTAVTAPETTAMQGKTVTITETVPAATVITAITLETAADQEAQAVTAAAPEETEIQARVETAAMQKIR